MNDHNKWYVVQTKPRNEFRAKRELSNQDYEAYLPEIERRRFKNGREGTVTEPLFPRYIFVRLSRVRNCWHHIRSTRGVKDLVVFGEGDPLPVSDQIMDTIRDRASEGTVQSRFEIGDQVRIMPSNTLDLEATTFWGQIESLEGEERAVLLMSLLGREHRIHVATDRLTLV